MRQPFYHRCGGAVLFTATRHISEAEFVAALERGLASKGLVKGSVEVECLNDGCGHLMSGYMEPEAGNPENL